MITHNSQNQKDREQWLTSAALFLQENVIKPSLPADHVIPYPFRVSVGFPPRTRANTRIIGVCIKAQASADLHNEIFINPQIDNSVEILEVLVHELIHQADNCESGHKNFFARTARKVGLIGHLTATKASPELLEVFKRMIDYIGAIPHAKIDLGQARKKQTTRLIKMTCRTCGWSFRISQAQIDAMQDNYCNACGCSGHKGLNTDQE